VGVGDSPDFLEQETTAPNGRGTTGGNGGRGNGNGGRRPKKTATKSARRSTSANNGDAEVEVAQPVKDRRVSRERSLNRLLAGLRAVNAGDFSVQLAANGDPLMADIIDVFNSVVQKQARLVDEVSRVSTSVGREGKMRDRVAMAGVGGQWVTAIDSVNSLITDLVQPTGEVSRVIKAVAEGDLSQKVELEIERKQVQGAFLRIG